MAASKASKPFRFAVEAGKIREFADAIGDRAQYFRSVRAAHQLGLPGIPAPTLFTRSSVFQEPSGYSVNRMIGIDPSLLRHAGHEWHVAEPLIAGKTYRVTPFTFIDDVTKPNRDGRDRRFITAERKFHSAAGKEVLVERMIVVVVGTDAPSTSPQAAMRAAESAPATDVRERQVMEWQPDWRLALPGSLVARVQTGPLSLTDIVRFAGAIGDFTPIHHDDQHARNTGLPGVIAMGMLPGAVVASLLEAGFGPTGIARLSMRFQNVLYTGPGLDIRIHADGKPEAGAGAVSFQVADTNGVLIISGSCTPHSRTGDA